MNSWRVGKYELRAYVRSLPVRRDVNSTSTVRRRHCSRVDTVRQRQSPSTHRGGCELAVFSDTAEVPFAPGAALHTDPTAAFRRVHHRYAR